MNQRHFYFPIGRQAVIMRRYCVGIMRGYCVGLMRVYCVDVMRGYYAGVLFGLIILSSQFILL